MNLESLECVYQRFPSTLANTLKQGLCPPLPSEFGLWADRCPLQRYVLEDSVCMR